MFETITAALISAATTLLVCLINGYFQTKKIEKKQDETITLVEYKLEELTKRVDKHNNVIERTFKLEELTALQEEKIKVANHRIEDLEHQQRG